MAFQRVPETAQVRMQFLYHGEQCENVFHVRGVGAWGAAEMNTLAGTFAGWWDTYLQDIVPMSCILQRVLVRDLDSAQGLAVEYTTGLPKAGTHATPGLPGSVAVAVKWGTGLAGRSYRGRTFHIGLTENQVTGNELISDMREGLRVAYDALRTALDSMALGVEFVVVSRESAGVVRPEAVTTPISGVSVDPFVDSQRRRLKGRGN